MYKHLYESAEQLDFPEPDIWISFNAGHVAAKLRLSEALGRRWSRAVQITC